MSFSFSATVFRGEVTVNAFSVFGVEPPSRPALPFIKPLAQRERDVGGLESEANLAGAG
jgi:hypothetical protein